MMQKETFKLFLRGKEFIIPSKFRSFYDVSHNISLELISTQKYFIKSNVQIEVLQSFIENWVNMKIPTLNENNISEYEELSREFERMESVIEIYHKLSPKNKYLQNKTQNLKNEIIQKEKLNQEPTKYQQVISYIFKNNETILFSPFANIKRLLQESIYKYNFELINFYSKKVTQEDGLLFILNEENKTAFLFQNQSATGDVFIPKSLKYQNDEYIITNIYSKSFQHSQKIKSIQFSPDSELISIDECSFEFSSIESITIPKKVTKIKERAFSNCYQLKRVDFEEPSEIKIIEKEVFFNSFIENLYIPSSIEKLESGWCFKTPCLINVSLSTNNEFFSIIENSFIFGKSDSKSDIYDIFHFARRDVTEVTVPSFIKEISPYAFNECKELKKIEFSNDSKLTFIGRNAFYYASIESISIPSHIKVIDDEAFLLCRKLNTINFSENSELKIVGKNAFSGTKIESISIPSNIEELKDDWCIGTGFLNRINLIEYDVKNISLFNDFFLLGKSNKDSEIFNVLLFARRDIESAFIPSFIREIAPNSFFGCSNLIKVEFSKDSELNSIGKNAFYSTGIQFISIPSHVIEICDSAFNYTNQLKTFNFADNSELLSIGPSMFMNSSLSEIVIPSSVIHIEKSCFYLCHQLEKIKFEENSNLMKINDSAFACCEIKSISIPSHVQFIGKSVFFCCYDLRIVEFQTNLVSLSKISDLFLKFDDIIILVPFTDFTLK